MIAQLASSSDFETSIAARRAGDVSLFTRLADRLRRLRAWPRRVSKDRRTDPQPHGTRDPRKSSGSWSRTRDAHDG